MMAGRLWVCKRGSAAGSAGRPAGLSGTTRGMASLITVKGPNPGRRFPLTGENTIIGRQPAAAIYLESLAVSRQHARVVRQGSGYHVEDMGSSNGTWVNGFRINGRVPLGDRDELQIGPYVLHLAVDRTEAG